VIEFAYKFIKNGYGFNCSLIISYMICVNEVLSKQWCITE
jgi:hypothetical protein